MNHTRVRHRSDERGEVEDRREPEPWHLSRSVPISLIFAITIQTISSIWWGATISAKVEEHDRRLIGIENYDQKVDGTQLTISERLARLEEKSSTQLETLQRIDAVIEGPHNRMEGSK